jgi:hypothetical protein
MAVVNRGAHLSEQLLDLARIYSHSEANGVQPVELHEPVLVVVRDQLPTGCHLHQAQAGFACGILILPLRLY